MAGSGKWTSDLCKIRALTNGQHSCCKGHGSGCWRGGDGPLVVLGPGEGAMDPVVLGAGEGVMDPKVFVFQKN